MEEMSEQKQVIFLNEEMEYDGHFVQNYYRENDGRFGVRLPFKKN